MTVQNVLAEIKEQTEEIKKIKQDLTQKLQPKFKDIFIPFFDKYPEVKEIKWRQYTPYFNDGEPCEFGVNELNGFFGTDDECEYEGSLPSYSIDEVVEYRKNGINDNWSDWQKEYYPKKSKEYPADTDRLQSLNTDFRQLNSLVMAIPEDIMLDLFGDHSEITVTKEGIDVEEYDHD